MGAKIKTPARRQYRVFLSHSAKDNWVAHQMTRLIEERGITVFLDEKDIEGGEDIAERIRTALEECNEFVVLLSRYSVNRQWVLIETGAAWMLKKRMTAIVDKITSQELPDILADLKYVDLNDFDRFLEEVSRRGNKSRKHSIPAKKSTWKKRKR